jgi:hypothetical protein
MKRKMMTPEKVPSKKTTNGGNGSYMRRAIMKDKKGGMTGVVTATGRKTLRAL